MAILLTYQPTIGISIFDKLLPWGISRQQSRDLLRLDYEESDSILDLREVYGNDSYNTLQKRDVYKNLEGQSNYLTLNFNAANSLKELEIHEGFDIKIETLIIGFQMDIEDAGDALARISVGRRQLSEGEYFFEDLQLVIASGAAMGGSGNELSYFYCSNDVSHLDF